MNFDKIEWTKKNIFSEKIRSMDQEVPGVEIGKSFVFIAGIFTTSCIVFGCVEPLKEIPSFNYTMASIQMPISVPAQNKSIASLSSSSFSLSSSVTPDSISHSLKEQLNSNEMVRLRDAQHNLLSSTNWIESRRVVVTSTKWHRQFASCFFFALLKC